MDAPFTLTLYDKSRTRTGWLGDPLEVKVTPRHNAIGDMTITVRGGHPKLGQMITQGSRLVCEYRGEFLMSGMMRSWQQTGGQTDGAVAVTYTDDVSHIWEILGWPNPTQLIGAQNTGGVKEDKVTGAAETVAKTFITRNGVTRLACPGLTVATTHGYGSTITVSFRMVPLADNLITAVDQAGVGLTVQQIGGDLVVDAYEPSMYPLPLSEQAGTLIPGTVSYTEATATRAIVAGPGVGTSREWLLRTDSAREAALNRRIEMLTDNSSETTSEREAAGDQALVAAGPKSGLSLGLAEAGTFRYGNGIHVGDTVTVDLGGGVLITDTLREVTLSWTRNEGLVITPAVGERADDPSWLLVQKLTEVARKVRRLMTT